MSRRTVVVIHREPLVAEALAGALDRYAWLASIAIGTDAADAARVPADAAVLDGSLSEARAVAQRLRDEGRLAVVLYPGCSPSDGSFPTDGPVAELARVLGPAVMTAHSDRTLTAREREVLSLVAKGLAGKQVARALGISPKTVEQHKTKIYGKLGVANQAAAVAAVATGAPEARWISSST